MNQHRQSLNCVLSNHLDSVRDLFFCSEDSILATVSEDSTVKLWDTTIFDRAMESSNIEPIYTLRESDGPIFSITGN